MSRTGWIARLFGWAVLAALTLEVSARVDDWASYGAPFWGKYSIETIYEYDELGKKGMPHGKYLKWELNSLGFRGPEVEPGKTTVITMGASETFGLYESPDHEYPRLLEAEISARLGTDELQVVNTAYPGLSVGSSLIRLKAILDELRPAAAVVYPALANYVDMPEGEWRLSKRPGPDGPLGRFRIWSRVRELIKETMPRAMQDWLRKRETAEYLAGREVWDRLPQENVDRFRTDLKALVQRLRMRGVEPLLVTHATRFGDALRPEDRTYVLMWRKFYPRLSEDAFLDMESRLNQAMREIAAQESVAMVDAAERIGGRRDLFVDYVHFTDEGSALMAQMIAEGLVPLLGMEPERQP